MFTLPPFLTVYLAVLAFLFGCCCGSFLNCMAWRIVHHESVLKGRSHCDSCGHILSLKDLFPIVSFLASKGRCRYCGAKLSKRHLLAEALCGLLFLGAILRYGVSFQTLEGWLFFSILMAASFADLEGYIIPDRFILSGIVLGVLSVLRRFLEGGQDWKAVIGSAIGSFGFFFLLYLVVLFMEKVLKREAMGGGDLKLLFVTGLVLGWQKQLLGLLLACVIGIVCGIFSLRAASASGEETEEGEAEASGMIPWGPSIGVAASAVFLFGDSIIQAYLRLF